MRIIVTGATGMLGQDVLRVLAAQGHECLGTSSADFDLRDAAAVLAAVKAFQPEAIVHCAAWTAVDAAESEPVACCAVNGMGTLNIARAAVAVNARLLYISTDYIFDGSGDTPREEYDKPNPRNVYGLSKLQGEEAVRSLTSRHFILRVSWLFGHGGGNFVETIRRLGQEKSQITVVDDQIGSPTYTLDLARLIAQMIITERYGTYNVTNEGFCSFADFARVILRADGSRCRVIPIPSSQYPSAARRPLNSRLSKRSLDENSFPRLPIWEDALRRYIVGD
ncbi:MAG: dTDP-4-dehydrorhamnose reductase [Clostridia bacterium]|nr:dTDP-4-dehydrorhamnose reductase [Clostridia bacterium]